MSDVLDLNLLRVFDALLRDGSVTAAAERLHLSIPATSRALGRLRRAMNDPILVRAGRGMAPTPFALRTAPRVRSLLDEASALVNAEFALADLKRTFTIRINDGVAATLATAAVEAAAAAAPGVTLRFVAEGFENTEALRDGSVDLDIGVGDVPAPDIRTAVLYRNGWSASSAPTARWAAAAGRPWPGCAGTRTSRRPGVAAPAGRWTTSWPPRACGATSPPSCPPTRWPRCWSRPAGTSGSSPQRLAEQHGAALGLRWFPIPVPLPELDVRLLWHARLDADPAQRWLRDTLREAVALTPCRPSNHE